MNGAMVRASLDGRKSKTRRIIKPQPRLDQSGWYPPPKQGQPPVARARHYANEDHLRRGLPIDFAPWRVGDRLWVREAWEDPADFCPWHQTSVLGAPCWCGSIEHVAYRATTAMGQGRRWRPSIHMPRWASRLTLEVLGVRVERLQDITEEDARDEGVDYCDEFDHDDCFHGGIGYRCSFERTWNLINGIESWDRNPWVWVVSFRRLAAEERAA